MTKWIQVRFRFNLDEKQYKKIKALSKKYHLNLGDIAKIFIVDRLDTKIDENLIKL